MKSINPYIRFEGKTLDAMGFYKAAFGGETHHIKAGETPVIEQMPPGSQDLIMHASLETSGMTLMGTDLNCTEIKAKNNFGIFCNCSSQEEIERLSKELATGGSTMCPLGPAFWGGQFCAVTDQFGIDWMLHFDG